MEKKKKAVSCAIFMDVISDMNVQQVKQKVDNFDMVAIFQSVYGLVW